MAPEDNPRDDDPHGECAAEIHLLQDQLVGAYRTIQVQQEEFGDLESRMKNVRTILETAVCTRGCDKGVVLLSNYGPTHPEVIDGKTVQTYDHDCFSPLGDALIEAWHATQCPHKWVEKTDSDLAEGWIEVECEACHVVGERNDKTGEVFSPAT